MANEVVKKTRRQKKQVARMKVDCEKVGLNELGIYVLYDG